MKRSQSVWFLLTCIFFLLFFFHPTLAFNPRELTDDQCYLKWLGQLVGFDSHSCPSQYTFPGTVLFWAPGALMAKTIAQMLGLDPISAIHSSIGLSAFLFWCLSLYLLTQVVRRLFILESNSYWFALCFLLAAPALHYATVRTTMAHSVELLLVSATLWAIVGKHFRWALLFSLLATLVRINDCFLLLVLLGSLLDQKSKQATTKAVTISLILVGLPIAYIAFFASYGSYYGGSHLILVLKEINLAQFLRINFDTDFGLFYTGTWWLIVLFAGLATIFKLSWASRANVFWMLFMYLICMGWGGHGNSFGYRYLIGTYPFALYVWRELRTIYGPIFQRSTVVLLAINAAWVTHLTWIYDHFSPLHTILGQSSGLTLLKQLLHPALRIWDYSVLGIAIRALFAGRSKVIFHGPFYTSIDGFQVYTVVVLALISLLLVLCVGYLFALKNTWAKSRSANFDSHF